MTAEEIREARHAIKRQLSGYQARKRELKQIEALMADLDGAPGGQNLDGMPRGSTVGDPVAAVVAQRLALREKYQAKLAELYEAQRAVEDMIESLDSVERELLRHRYIEGMTWEGVCVAISYSWRQTHNLHAQALDKLAEGGAHGKAG